MARRRTGRADHYSQKAQRDGYAARSVYKLEEIDKRWRVIRRGAAVLDLGCAPGSWTKFAAEKVGAQGLVHGYDLKPVTAAIGLPTHAKTFVLDVNELALVDRGDSLPGFREQPELAFGTAAPYDVVLSDMAPATMGDHQTDALRSMGLAESAFEIAKVQLCSGGNFVVKLLEGGDTPNFVVGLRRWFTTVRRLRPKATRKVSTETFLVGLGYRREQQ